MSFGWSTIQKRFVEEHDPNFLRCVIPFLYSSWKCGSKFFQIIRIFFQSFQRRLIGFANNVKYRSNKVALFGQV